MRGRHHPVRGARTRTRAATPRAARRAQGISTKPWTRDALRLPALSPRQADRRRRARSLLPFKSGRVSSPSPLLTRTKSQSHSNRNRERRSRGPPHNAAATAAERTWNRPSLPIDLPPRPSPPFASPLTLDRNQGSRGSGGKCRAASETRDKLSLAPSHTLSQPHLPFRTIVARRPLPTSRRV